MSERKRHDIYSVFYVEEEERWHLALTRSGSRYNTVFSSDTREACEKMKELNIKFPFK